MESSYKNYMYYRNRSGLSDYQLAQKAGISRGILSDWKNEKHFPHNKTLKKIADALGVTVNDFYRTTPEDVLSDTPSRELLLEAEKKIRNTDFVNRYLAGYTIYLRSGETIEISIEEYKELQTAVEIFVDSWIKSKKMKG